MDDIRQEQPESPKYDVSKEAVRRWFMELGEGFESTCRMMNAQDGLRYHIYEVRVREKTGNAQGVLLLLKAFGEAGALIAFHQDNSLLQAFINVGKRLANGSIEFEEDAFPPKDYDVRAKAHSKEMEYFRSSRPPA